MINLRDLYWLSGVVEGEGCFTFGHGKRKETHSTEMKIELETTDEDIALRVHRILSGSYIHKYNYNVDKGYKDKYKVAIYSTPAIAWMMTLYTLMGKRRKERIRELINIWKSETLQRRSKTPMEKMIRDARRLKLPEEMIEVLKNHKGVIN